MRDYVELVKALNEISYKTSCYYCHGESLDCKTAGCYIIDAADAIEELLAAVNSVVKCKDCKFWTKQESSAQGRCALLAIYPTGGFYCGAGRKDDA